ncbi:1-acyl-sn-glycerol-3-phosphate acyltransferase [Halioxenophilus aromaticivorans]|uniref:1-acyl-sn-glycerol-3-phosphate acyltransferase n=1 Tax=Halioxenophilus aromaticivorans TaxID=1306992 RepID=A0AAV3TZK5_9ALTE
MSKFDDIRPYNDDEVRPTITKLLANDELLHAVASLQYPNAVIRHPKLMRFLAKRFMHWQLRGADDVTGVQHVLEKYLRKNLDNTTTELTHSGLERLDPSQSYLFVSNHRDIAMDPALINWVLYNKGFSTVRIAIGDNLLTKDYASDLMRLNKTFIVKRSATSPREKFKAAKHLSAYIHHSLHEDNCNIWIAQREGRAKDGRDITNRAIISMFCLNKPKTDDFGDYITNMNIVPVSISYEWDPCDIAKANELYQLQAYGEYSKQEHEDVESIAKGIRGQKGRVHVAFGEVLGEGFNDAEVVALEVERQIQRQYVLQPSNLAAYYLLYHLTPETLKWGVDEKPFVVEEHESVFKELNRRLESVPEEQRTILLSGYANPVLSKLAHLNSLSQASSV